METLPAVHVCTKEKDACRPEKNSPSTVRRRPKNFEGFMHVKTPRSNLVIKVNFRGSFKIDSKTGVLIAEI